MSRNIGCTPRQNQFLSERDVSPVLYRDYFVSKRLVSKYIYTKAKMAVGNKLIDSDLRKAIYIQLYFSYRVCLGVPITDYSKKRRTSG